MNIVRDFVYSMVVVTHEGNDAIVDFIHSNTPGATHIIEAEGLRVIQSWLEEDKYREFYVMAINKEGPFEGCYTTFKNARTWMESHDDHMRATVAHYKSIRT